MIHKTIVVTIGLALVLIAVISAVPVTSQKTYAQAGSPGVGSNGGSGTGGLTVNAGSTGAGGSGSHGITCNVGSSGTGGSGPSPGGGNGQPACGLGISNCILGPRGGSCNAAAVGTGGSGAGGSTAVVGKIGQGGNSKVANGGAP